MRVKKWIMQKLKDRQLWVLWIIILLQLTVMFFWMGQKEGVHVDEMYSLESAHNLRISDLGSDNFRLTDMEEWYNNWKKGEDYNRHFTVNDGESFLSAPFGDKIDMIAYESTYEIMLNLLLSVTEGRYNLLYPMLLNMCFFLLIQLVLYKIGRYIYGEDIKALFPLLFFGFTAGAVNMTLYVRTYTLIMLLSILQVWVHILLLEGRNTKIQGCIAYVSIPVMGYFGYLCHQYTVVLVASVSLAYFIMSLIKKRWKQGIGYLIYLGGLGSAYVIKTGIWRSFIDGDGNEARALEGLLIRDWEKWKFYLQEFGKTCVKNALGGPIVFWGLVLTCLLVIVNKKRKEGTCWCAWSEKEKLVLFLSFFSSIIFWMLLSRIAPDNVTRYISYLFPVLSIMIGVLLNHITEGMSKRIMYGSAAFLTVIMIITNVKFGYIENLYRELIPIKETLQEEKYQIDNVYINSNRKEYLGRHQIYCDIYLFQPGLRYYVTTPETLKNPDTSILKGYNSKAVLLWIDSSEDQLEIFNDFMEKSGFNSAVELEFTQKSTVYYCEKV